MTKKMEQALAVLKMFINDMGKEYPNAHAIVSRQFSLTDKQAEQLTKAYDDDCANPKGTCVFCGSTILINDSEVLTLDVKGYEGDKVCLTCQCDAAANFGQMRDNIKHLGLFQNLIVQWAKE